MRKQYHLTLNCTQTETEYRLKQQLRFLFPKGNVDGNHFSIYKKPIGYGNNHFMPSFRFDGEFQQSGNRTIVTYQIHPLLTIYLTYALLLFIVLYMTYTVLVLQQTVINTLGALGMLLFFHFFTLYQKKKCIADFEKRLTTEISWKK